jgi:type VI protein secretion system component Hcp
MNVDGLNADNPTPILNFNVGASNPTTSGGAGAGKVSFSALNVTKLLDGLSVSLLRAEATGHHFPHVTIEVFEAGQTSPFAIYTFGLVFVTSDVLGSGESALAAQLQFGT